MSGKIATHRDLDVYRRAFEAAMQIFEMSKSFPKEETYALTDQVRRSSRSVCANLAEAWRKRRYEKTFVSKLNDAEAEAAETQVWLDSPSPVTTSPQTMPVSFTATTTASCAPSSA